MALIGQGALEKKIFENGGHKYVYSPQAGADNPLGQIFLAHLSRRLKGYPWIRLPSVRPFTFSNVFSSETAWQIKAKFYVEPPWEGGTKVYINGPGHMTKMAATPISGKN